MADVILVLNAGSSSLKFGLYESGDGDAPQARIRGQIEDVDDAPRLVSQDASGAPVADERWPIDATEPDALVSKLIAWIESGLGTDRLVAAGHRIVHGGREFRAPCRLDDATIDALDALTTLAPLHQPKSLAPVRALKRLQPDLPQFGCFDTAFHHRLEPPVSRYAIPRAWEAKGVRRYGFHGLSYEHIVHRLAGMSPDRSAKRTVAAHLGNGASLCAMRHGKSVDTTMGFTALDGLMMGTRCGAIDPGVLLYLQQDGGLSLVDVERLLYRESGLLGVSGLSSDMQTLLASDDPNAAEAIDLFVHMAVREIAAMAASLEGLEQLVFTGGVGERAPRVRSMICRKLRWLGVHIDEAANMSGAEKISDGTSAVSVLVMKADEEIAIARSVSRLIGLPSHGSPGRGPGTTQSEDREADAVPDPSALRRETSSSLVAAYGRELFVLIATIGVIAAVSLWRSLAQ